MKDGPNVARIAALLGDTARADVLTALMTDRALTATELAVIAGVTKQTMSAHLSKLLDASLVAVDQQGRHRYFRLADEDVAALLESLMGVAFRTGAVRLVSSPREPALREARICYDHLAGETGVAAYEALLRIGAFELSGGALRLYAFGPGGDRYEDVVPEHDSLIVFPSWAAHEVLPIACPSGRFADSRFALNCWFLRARAPVANAS